MNRDSLVLLAFSFRHYAYYWFPAEAQTDAWNITTSVIMLGVICLLRPAWYIGAWAVAEELLVIGCTAYWYFDPWQIIPGQDRCSARLDLKISAIGLSMLAFITLRHAVRVVMLNPRGRDGQ